MLIYSYIYNILNRPRINKLASVNNFQKNSIVIAKHYFLRRLTNKPRFENNFNNKSIFKFKKMLLI